MPLFKSQNLQNQTAVDTVCSLPQKGEIPNTVAGLNYIELNVFKKLEELLDLKLIKSFGANLPTHLVPVVKHDD